MKFGVVNKSTTVNRFFLHTLQRKITLLVVKTRKTNIRLVILKGGGGTGKEPPQDVLWPFEELRLRLASIIKPECRLFRLFFFGKPKR